MNGNGDIMINPTASRSSPGSGLASRIAGVADRGTWLPVAVFVALVAIFSIASPAFFSWRNFAATSGEAATLLIASLGATFVILMGSIDLSVGAVVLLVGTTSVATLKLFPGASLGPLVLPFGALLGALLGAFNGAISVYGRVPSFVVTLGSLSVFTGAALSILAGATIMFDLPFFDVLSLRQTIPHLPNIALWALLLWLLAIFVGARTRFGRFVMLIGGGEQVARTAGIPVDRYKIYAFTVSGMTAGLAGIFAMSRLGAVGPSLGSDLLLNTLGAIVVGGTSLAGGAGGVQRTFIGVAIITVLSNGLNLVGVGPYWQLVIKGFVVIGAVLISQDRIGQLIVK
jgi:ribose/xylose/arabinose/galactoside ABC-type transport system permease subunit